MKTVEKIIKTREYLDYLEDHINNVNKAWEIVKDKCKDMRFIWDDFYYFSLNEAIKNHDISKLSKEEFTEYRECFFPTDDEPKEKRLKDAWEHHKKHNYHHWEKWTTENLYQPNEWEVHCAHMVIDWMSMGFKFNDTAQEYYEKNKDKIKLPDYAIRFIYEIFKRIGKE